MTLFVVLLTLFDGLYLNIDTEYMVYLDTRFKLTNSRHFCYGSHMKNITGKFEKKSDNLLKTVFLWNKYPIFKLFLSNGSEFKKKLTLDKKKFLCFARILRRKFNYDAYVTGLSN